MFYWLTSISYAVSGSATAFTARLPTALVVVALVVVTYQIGMLVFGWQAGFFGGLALATSAGTFLFTRIVLPEPILTLWLALWTVGGVGAFQQLLWLLFGRDVVRWGGDALEAHHSALWFVTRERLDARAITGFRLFRGTVVADSREAAVRVTRLGSDADRQELCAMLEAWRSTIAPPEPLAEDRSPVPAFVAFRDETGAIALERPRGPRRSTGVWMGALALALFSGVVALFSQKTGAALVVGVLFLGLAGAGCLAGSLWMLAARESWHLRQGKLEHRRTWFGRTWSAEFVPLELQLSSASDSDGDLRWSLVVSGAGRRHTIASAIDDPNTPLTLGLWLAARTGARFVRRDLEPTLRRAG